MAIFIFTIPPIQLNQQRAPLYDTHFLINFLCWRKCLTSVSANIDIQAKCKSNPLICKWMTPTKCLIELINGQDRGLLTAHSFYVQLIGMTDLPASSGRRWSASRWIRIQTEKVVSANAFHMPKNDRFKSHLCILTELSSDNNCRNRWQRFFEIIRGAQFQRQKCHHRDLQIPSP